MRHWRIEWRCLACVWLFIVMSLFKRCIIFIMFFFCKKNVIVKILFFFFFSFFQIHQQPSAARRSYRSTCLVLLVFALFSPKLEKLVAVSSRPLNGFCFFFFTLRLCWGREIIGSGMETTAETVVLFLVRYIHRLLFSTRKKLLFRVKGFELNTFVKRIESKETLNQGCTPAPPTLGQCTGPWNAVYFVEAYMSLHQVNLLSNFYIFFYHLKLCVACSSTKSQRCWHWNLINK